MFVARNELHALAGSERNQVVVTRVNRMNRRRASRVRNDLRELLEEADDPNGVLMRDSVADLRSGEGPSIRGLETTSSN